MQPYTEANQGNLGKTESTGESSQGATRSKTDKRLEVLATRWWIVVYKQKAKEHKRLNVTRRRNYPIKLIIRSWLTLYRKCIHPHTSRGCFTHRTVWKVFLQTLETGDVEDMESWSRVSLIAHSNPMVRTQHRTARDSLAVQFPMLKGWRISPGQFNNSWGNNQGSGIWRKVQNLCRHLSEEMVRRKSCWTGKRSYRWMNFSTTNSHSGRLPQCHMAQKVSVW